MSWLINAQQLDKFRKSQKNVIILDASFFHQGDRDAKAEFTEKHIVDAYFFDIDLLSDPRTDLPHMLYLDETVLSDKIGSLGIRNDSKIIIYDNSDLHTACRALWMLKMAGHHPQQLYISSYRLFQHQQADSLLPGQHAFVNNYPWLYKNPVFQPVQI